MKKIHLIGIGGTGLSAIAHLLLERGYQVSGSDRAASAFTDELIRAGATIFIGHAAENIRGANIVVRSSAVTTDNPEVKAAEAAHIPVLKRSEFLGELLNDYIGLAVAGTHGKTTTTSMLAWTLTDAGYAPSYIIGGISKNLGNNAHAGKEPYFVIEADEYDGMFLGLNPTWAIVTNMEHDHPDCYPTPADYVGAFYAFAAQIKPGGGLLVCGDMPDLIKLGSHIPAGAQALTYGLSPKNNYSAQSLVVESGGVSRFTLTYQGRPLVPVKMPLAGEHNVRNALAVLGVCHQLEIDLGKATRALASFSGTGRRFDILGVAQNITLIDDYGHHPTEIRATLQAARSRYPQSRIWAVWQPHTYSRTMTLFNDFINAFQIADGVVVTEVYAARESNPGFSAAQLVEKMQHPLKHFSPSLDEATAYLKNNVQPGDVVLVLSAGDANLITVRLFDYLNRTLSEKELSNG
jgi:UDP-N-acetylmuramate--alanine ligase